MIDLLIYVIFYLLIGIIPCGYMAYCDSKSGVIYRAIDIIPIAFYILLWPVVLLITIYSHCQDIIHDRIFLDDKNHEKERIFILTHFILCLVIAVILFFVAGCATLQYSKCEHEAMKHDGPYAVGYFDYNGVRIYHIHAKSDINSVPEGFVPTGIISTKYNALYIINRNLDRCMFGD